MNPGDGSTPYPAPRPPGVAPTPAPGTPPVASPTPRPGYGGGGGHHDDDDDKDCNNRDRDHDHGGENSPSSTAPARFICVLQGPGKSIKLGLRPTALASGTSADQAVCMTKNACLNIVSKAFLVKMADRRGFCKQSRASGRVSMSDAQMENAVHKGKDPSVHARILTETSGLWVAKPQRHRKIVRPQRKLWGFFVSE